MAYDYYSERGLSENARRRDALTLVAAVVISIFVIGGLMTMVF